MTTTAKVVLGIIIVILIALGAYYFSQQGSSGTMNGSPAAQTGTQGGAQSATSPNDASDAALIKDSAAIDAQINGFASDNTTVDSGLNDKPVAP